MILSLPPDRVRGVKIVNLDKIRELNYSNISITDGISLELLLNKGFKCWSLNIYEFL